MLRRRREERDLALATFLAQRRLVVEDVMVFGEEMSAWHVDTLTDDLSAEAGDYDRYALESYERAKAGLEAATTSADLSTVVRTPVDGRHQRACVLAALAGEPVASKWEECFFNPQRGPSSAGVAPAVRLVRVGDRHVPWHQAADGSGGYRPPADRRRGRALPDRHGARRRRPARRRRVRVRGHLDDAGRWTGTRMEPSRST